MGNSPSDEYGGDDDALDPFDGIDTLGYRVLGVQPNSPASKAGLVSFLDFLVGANEKMLLGSGEELEEGEEYDDVDLPQLLSSNINKPIEFCKYETESRCSARTTVVTDIGSLSNESLISCPVSRSLNSGLEY